MSLKVLNPAAAFAAGLALMALAGGPAAGQAGDLRVVKAEDAAAQYPDGWTYDSLEDADVVAEDGRELGEVEAILADATGLVMAVAVELEDADDRMVVFPLTGADTVGTDDDRDIRTSLSPQALAALPEWRRP